MMGGPGGRGGVPMRGRMNAEKPKSAKKTLGRLLRYIGSSKATLISIIIIMAIVTCLDLAAPWLQGEAIDMIKLDPVTKEVSVKFYNDEEGLGIVGYLSIMAVVYVLSSVFTFFSNLLANRLSMKTVYKLRRDLFHKISPLNPMIWCRGSGRTGFCRR